MNTTTNEKEGQAENCATTAKPQNLAVHLFLSGTPKWTEEEEGGEEKCSFHYLILVGRGDKGSIHFPRRFSIQFLLTAKGEGKNEENFTLPPNLIRSSKHNCHPLPK